MEFKEKMPLWENEGVEPPKSKRESGWTAGDKPPADWFNWLHNRTYKSLLELRENSSKLKELVDDKADIKDLEKVIEDMPSDFHDVPQNSVNEDMAPLEFEHGLTLCSHSNVNGFPTINDYGVSITLRGKNISYAQFFVTRHGDIWSRRSATIDEWNGEWYNAKRNIQDLHKDLEKIQEDVNKNKGSISDASDTGIVTTEHDRQVNVSTKSKSSGIRSIVSASLDSETNTNTSAVIASSDSKINDTDPRFRRNMVMLASDDFEFDPSSANDHKVVGGYKGNLAWMLDTRKGEIYAKDEIKVGDKKLSTMAKSSTIVIANYDSHENSKASADIVIKSSEDAGVIITREINKLSGTGGKVYLAEGNYDVNTSIEIKYDNITLEGAGEATSLISKASSVNNSNLAVIRIIESTNIAIKNVRITSSVKNKYDGIRAIGSEVEVINCTITNIDFHGIIANDSSTVRVLNSNISNNSKSGILNETSSKIAVNNCTFAENDMNGIVSLASASDIKINNSDFVKNISDGVRIYNEDGIGYIVNCYFEDNNMNNEYANEGNLVLGFNNEFNTKSFFATGCHFVSKHKTRGIVIRGKNHVVTNNNFVGEFEVTINDGGTDSIVKNNMGV